MPKKRIYLDHAATTPVDAKVLKEMLPYFSKKFGNSFSVHSWGQEAAIAVDKARNQIIKFLGASEAREIVFTSGATEANNWVISGVAKAIKNDLRKSGRENTPIHIITSSIEHHCVLNSSKSSEEEGIRVTFIPVNKEGLVDPHDIEKAITSETVLVSIMYANNEVGTIQPIREIGEIIKKANEKRLQNKERKILFHTDAVQAANYLNCDVNYLGVDFLTLSAHKIYGPKGIGCLYIRKGARIAIGQYGGEQEWNLRAGTHNVPGIVGMGKAIELIEKRKKDIPKIKKMRDKLIDGILRTMPNSQLNGSREFRLPHNANFSFPGVEGESLIMSLDMEGIAASTGSACSSASLEPSHVLTSMGIPPEIAHASLRLTLGKDTKNSDIDYALKTLPVIIARLRKISGYR